LRPYSTGFNYNYGQYFVFWDHLGGTFRDPFKVAPYNGLPIRKKGKATAQPIENRKITQKAE